ncbi:MAG: pseudouridine-5'-phosphate glycosidase [Gemmatimonadota bacterium]
MAVRHATLLRFAPEVGDAVIRERPVVALESSVLAQGLPIPVNGEAAERMRAAIARHGATPAITAVVRGQPTIGLTSDELARFLKRDGIHKLSARDLATAVVHQWDGATTVAASLVLCREAGVHVFATGGIGGVHRHSAFDESADLTELARTPVVVVCAGAKSILDLPATVERLETLGVTIVGYGTDELPGFFTQQTGLKLSARADSVQEVVQMFDVERRLRRPGALVVVVPPPSDVALSSAEVEAAVTSALSEAQRQRLAGSAVTPFLLAQVERATAGRSLVANVALLQQNAGVAAQIARALSSGL